MVFVAQFVAVFLDGSVHLSEAFQLDEYASNHCDFRCECRAMLVCKRRSHATGFEAVVENSQWLRSEERLSKDEAFDELVGSQSRQERSCGFGE